MSNFWQLWQQAENGDVDAAQQVNVLVAKRNGYEIELKEQRSRSYLWSVNHASFLFPRNVLTRANDIDGAWRQACAEHLVPDYMSDLNASAGLVLPNGYYMSIDTVTSGESNPDPCRARVIEAFTDPDRSYIIAQSQSECRARVGAWWIATTDDPMSEQAKYRFRKILHSE